MSMRVIVGANVRRLRKARHLTQERVSELTDLSQQYLSELENGKHNPTVETLEKLATALGSTAAELVTPPA